MMHTQTPRIIVCALLTCTTCVFANHAQSTAPSGIVHMRGRLDTGACVVSSDSRDLHVEMGKYSTKFFEKAGDISNPGIPFTLNLNGCGTALAGVGISFSGVADPKDPDVFKVSTSESRPTSVSGKNVYSGLGLLLKDIAGNVVIPNAPPQIFYSSGGVDMALHFVAYYRATSQTAYPSELHSDVRFDISYP